MKLQVSLSRLTQAALIVCLILTFLQPLTAQTEQILYSFSGGPTDGGVPQGGLLRDATGHLYGVGDHGGSGMYPCQPNCGVLFELSRGAKGNWSEKILHNFGSTENDGTGPNALVRDASGNFYGTTNSGGLYKLGNGAGTVYEFSMPNKYQTLYEFTDGTDGGYPSAGLVLDEKGNLYGTTSSGGSTSCNCGTVFELAKVGSTYKEKVLHGFVNNGADGYNPGSLIYANGNIYGVTTSGGLYGGGTAFMLSRNGTGSWKYDVVYNFGAYTYDAITPSSGLTLYDGNFYGTSLYGGNSNNGGTVFQLSSSAGDLWSEQVLVNFEYQIGRNPSGGVAFDSQGNLYATTLWNGSNTSYNCGTLDEFSGLGYGLSQVLWNFGGSLDGCHPSGSLTIDPSGNIYGSAPQGGGSGFGIIYEVVP